MRKTRWLLISVSLLVFSVSVQAQVSPRLLRNEDVLRMVEDRVPTDTIIRKILTSSCNFDVFPPELRNLKRRGVPEKVLMVMKVVPNGPPGLPDVDASPQPDVPHVQIPEGTLIEVETATETSSARAVAGNMITFFVKRRIFVDNVLVVERGAVARARIVQVKRARPLGRAGMLAWELDYIVGIDGTRIPVTLHGKQTGSNRTALMAGGAVATGALVFPYSSPVALVWGLKKGDEAVLRGSRLFAARVKTQTEIAGIQPRQGGVVYHKPETVKASAAPPTKTNFERGFGRKRSNRQ
jgi:hypothetical protein